MRYGGETLSVVSYPDGRIELVRGEEVLPFKVFDAVRPLPETAADDMTFNVRVDELLKRRRWSDKSRPAPNHPWRCYPAAASSGAGQLASP